MWEKYKEEDLQKKNIKMKNFLQNSVDIWNGLNKEVDKVKSIPAFEEKLDKSRYTDRTL